MGCLTPIKVKNKSPDIGGFAFNVVPCGKCPECRRERINSWVFRLTQQERVQKSAVFVTLTYDKPPISGNGFMTLCKEDCQKFFKRLRFNTGRKSIKYYLAGEYGSRTKRPHYHAIIFDASDVEISKAWGFGYVHCGNVSSDSIAYCAKYIDKPSLIPLFEKDDRCKEFSLMSKGMGKNYLSPAKIKWHKQDGFRNYLPLQGGFTCKLPRYYRDKIFDDNDKKYLNWLAQKEATEKFSREVEKYGSEREMYKVKFENVKAYIENKNRRDAEKRNKI